jgi:hypothetical protein
MKRILILMALTTNIYAYDVSFIAGGKAYTHIIDGKLAGIGPSEYLKDNNLKFFYPFLPLSIGNNITALQFPWVFIVQKFDNMDCYHVVGSTHTSCVSN